MYTWVLGIEYDPLKAESNLKKHGVSFPEAISALYDPRALAMEDPFSEGEPWILIGQSKNARLLTVIYALRHESIRIVSARPAKDVPHLKKPNSAGQYLARTGNRKYAY